MSLSSFIPFTDTSADLQQFIAQQLPNETHHTSRAPVNLRHHRSLLQSLKRHTQRWHVEFTGTQTTQKCPAFPHPLTLNMPSKLYVLKAILTHNGGVLACARRHLYTEVPETASEATELVARLNDSADVDWQWFHIHAHQQLLLLTNRKMMGILDDVDDVCIRQALKRWRYFPELYDYFVPLNVQYMYEKQLHCSTIHTWSWDKHTYELEVFTPRTTLRKCFLHQICYRITMMSMLGPHPCSHLRLKWFPSTCTKEVGESLKPCCAHRHHHEAPPPHTTPPQATVWNPYQINTGATYRNTCDSVTIWRLEEAGKTFLHEMMHGYGWDFDMPHTRLHRWIHRHFAVDPHIEIRFYESYVETWATLLNVYMTVMYYASRPPKSTTPKKPPKNASQTHTRSKRRATRQSFAVVGAVKHIKHLVACERNFVLFQVAKVLVRSGFSVWEDFFKQNEAPRNATDVRFHQETSVFSYFVVRVAHLWDVSWFTQRFVNPPFRLHKTHTIFDEWLEHLSSIYSSPSFADAINIRMKWVRNNDAQGASNKHEKATKTMRMTITEAIA